MIEGKKELLKKDIIDTLRELIQELYSSGQVKKLDTIILDSYLLMNDKMYESMKENLRENFPDVTLIDIEESPVGIIK